MHFICLTETSQRKKEVSTRIEVQTDPLGKNAKKNRSLHTRRVTKSLRDSAPQATKTDLVGNEEEEEDERTSTIVERLQQEISTTTGYWDLKMVIGPLRHRQDADLISEKWKLGARVRSYRLVLGVILADMYGLNVYVGDTNFLKTFIESFISNITQMKHLEQIVKNL